MDQLVLSLFPGIGLLDMAFEQVGFSVVRGPDTLWGGDIKRFHVPARRFEGVIGGPPCQAFSRLRHLVEHNGYTVAENLIPEFERICGEAQPIWFLMENVPAAPEPTVPGYIVNSLLLNNRWLGGVQNRVRRFSFGTRTGIALDVCVCALEALDWQPAVMASGTRPTPVRLGPKGKPKRTAARNIGYKTRDYLQRGCVLQGLPADFLDDAPFTVAGKIKVVGNGVPLEMGLAIAGAIKAATGGG